MFSPWYAAARRQGSADPEDHVSINAALYGPGGRWAMTERGKAALTRDDDRLSIGPSAIEAGPGRIEIRLDEWSVPIPRRLKGRILIDTGPVFGTDHALDEGGRHLWRPIAPLARAAVLFENPRLAWRGSAYVDANFGSEPLEAGFRSWTWSRAHSAGAARLFYDVERRDGSRSGIHLALRPNGSETVPDAPSLEPLPPTLWKVSRALRSEEPPRDLRTLEDTPFYTRTAAVSTLCGRPCPTVCESVDLDRFAARWVQALLPFRMPRLR